MRTRAQTTAIVAGLVAAGAFFLPFLLSGGNDSGGSGLVAMLFGWVFVLPIALLIAVIAAGAASLSAIRSRATPSRERLRILLSWVAVLTIAGVAFVLSYGSLPAPIRGIVLAAVLLPLVIGTGTVGAAMVFRQREDPAAGARVTGRTLRIVCVSVGALAIGVALIALLAQLARADQYRVNGETVAYNGENEARHTAEAERYLAAACLGAPQAHERLTQAEELIRLRGADVFTPDEQRSMSEAVAASRTELESMDLTSCEAEAQRVSSALAATGATTTLADTDWLDSFAVRDAYEEAGLEVEPPALPELGFFEVTAERASDANERASSATERMQAAMAASSEAGDLFWPVKNALFDIYKDPGLSIAAGAPASAERVIAASGAEGTPAATELRALADNLARTGTGAFAESLKSYVIAAEALLQESS